MFQPLAIPDAPAVIRGISSMATRALFDELLTLYAHDEAVGIRIEAAGGVEVVRRIETGENFDLVVFASDAIDRLITAGLLLVGSTVDRCAF